MTASCVNKRVVADGRRGFGLVLALVVMSLVLLLAIAASMFLAVELRLTAEFVAREKARLNAIFAMRVAMAELQMNLGPDCAATFPMVGRHRWTAVEIVANGETGRVVPLVSGSHFLEKGGTPPLGWAEIVPAVLSSTGEIIEPAVEVPWVGNDADSRNARGVGRGLATGAGRMAYWIADESQKVDVGAGEHGEWVLCPDVQTQRQLMSQRHGVDVALGVRRADVQRWRDGLSVAGDWGWLDLAWREGAAEDEAAVLNPRYHTWASRGVLADALRGGLRINWDQRNPELPDEKLPCPRAVWEDFFRLSSESAQTLVRNPAAGLPVTPAMDEVALRRFPVLTALRLQMGLFHSHHDALHRTRFHADVQLWNPFPHPLVCVAKESRIGLLDFEKMPVVTIRNCNTGGAITVDMSAFPEGKFDGRIEQTKSDGTANAYLDMVDKQLAGMSAPGLFAGEVYNFAMPHNQPQGLERTLSATKWYVQSDPKKPATPPANATNGNWIHDTHRVEINGVMPSGGVTLHIRTMKGNLPKDVASRDYSAPVLTLKNIPFRDFALTLSGADYDRPDSTSYRMNEARIAFSLRMRSRDPELMEAALKTVDPREPVLDFSIPAVAALYEVSADVVSGRAWALPARLDESFWWDAGDNKHDATGDATAAASVRAFDRPVASPPVSVASLRHLQRLGEGAGSLNVNYPAGVEKDAEWFDRAFFAGAWPGGVGVAPRLWSRNAWLELLRTDDPTELASDVPMRENAAARCLVRGTFNVNCESAEAWRAVLARTLPDWSRRPQSTPATTAPSATWLAAALPMSDAGGGGRLLPNVFFRLAFSADQVLRENGLECDLPDEKLRHASAVTWAYCEGRQGFRALEDSARDRLAEELAAAIRRYHAREGAFCSLKEFALSGVIAEAIDKSGLNRQTVLGRTPRPVSPLRLNAGDVLEALLPVLAVRGDTFKIYAQGASMTALGRREAQVNLEVVVQRFPQCFDSAQDAMTPPEKLNLMNRCFGRRFKIVSYRWMNAVE